MRDVPEFSHWVASIYYHAELALLERATLEARTLESGITDATLVKLRHFANYERYAHNVLSHAHRIVIAEMQLVIEQAVQEGYAAAALDLTQLGYPPAIMPQQRAMVDLIVRDLEATLANLPATVLRQAGDAFQHVQAVASGQVSLGALTRIEASQYALDELARRGITGFTDKAGRNWGADTYAEMSVRTGAMNAAINTRLETYSSNGWDLVLVSDSPRECDMCRPWEHQVLTIGGVPGPRTVEDMLTGGITTVDVMATVDEARAQGLFHPNCTHNATAFIPGATRETPTFDDPELYVQTQHQRYMERNIRAWTRRHATALDDIHKTYADTKIREWEDRLDDLLARHSGLRRRPERENPFIAR